MGEKREGSSTFEEALKEMNELQSMVLLTNKKTLELSQLLREILESKNYVNDEKVWQRVQDFLLSVEVEKTQLQGMTDALAEKYKGNDIDALDKNDEMIKLKRIRRLQLMKLFELRNE